MASQTLPNFFSADSYVNVKHVLDALLYTALAYIMINVGREFELNKKEWRSYTNDYFIAMATAAVPWLLVCFYFIYLMPEGSFGNWDVWKENLLLSRFAAPTSAGILFTMLAAANLKKSWIYQKIQVLAIFDDLDTILLMIPLQIFMIGMKWQLGIVVLFVVVCLVFGWEKLNVYKIKQGWKSLLLYSVLLVLVFQGVYILSKSVFGADGAIHIEVLLPAFVLGMVMKTNHNESSIDKKVSGAVSYIFMFLVGMSAPMFINSMQSVAQETQIVAMSDMPEMAWGEIVCHSPEAVSSAIVVEDNIDEISQVAQSQSASVTASIPPMSWGEILLHVLVVTLLSNIGKMFPLLSYRDRKFKERLALSVGMFTRGEVGAGIIFIAIGYGLGGPLLTISLLTIVANLLLTGAFVLLVKYLAIKVRKENIQERRMKRMELNRA